MYHWSKHKLGKLLPPEIIALLKRKLNWTGQQNRAHSDIPRYTETSIFLGDKEILIPDMASYRFMFKEIFSEHIYRFNSSTKTPYIIDGGANIGLASIYLKQLFPEARIIAFEPDPYIFNILKKNIKSFGYEDIELIPKGLWERDDTLAFKSEGADAGILGKVDESVQTTQDVPVISLRPYLEKKVDFLKLDIEGAEINVLRDIEDKLEMVNHIFVEYHSFIGKNQCLSEIINILSNSGFRLYMSNPGGNALSSPFLGLGDYNNMDFQLNIFGFREK